MTDYQLLVLILVFVGFANIKGYRPKAGAGWFFGAALGVTAKKVLESIAIGQKTFDHPNFLVIFGLLGAVTFLFAWIGAWKVMTQKSSDE